MENTDSYISDTGKTGLLYINSKIRTVPHRKKKKKSKENSKWIKDLNVKPEIINSSSVQFSCSVVSDSL